MTLHPRQIRGQSRARVLEARVALLRRENAELQAALEAARREHREFVAAAKTEHDRLSTMLEQVLARQPPRRPRGRRKRAPPVRA